MAEKHFDPEDPMALVGTRIPFPADTDVDAVIGRALVEEYALMGTSPHGIRELFTHPRYSGTHDIWRRRGPGFVEELISGVFGVETAAASRPQGHRSIPVRNARAGGGLDG